MRASPKFFLALLTLIPFCAAAQLATSPWPKFRGNASNSGQGVGTGATGVLQWATPISNATVSSPVIGNSGAVYIGAGASVYALSGTKGTILWSFLTKGIVYGTPAVGSDGTVYVGSSDGNLYALDGGSGAKKWSVPVGGTGISSPALGTDGTIYMGGEGPASGYLFALNPMDGSTRWSFPCSRVISSPAVGSDGTIYFGANDFTVYALNSMDGSVKWSFTSGGPVQSAPAIGADGTLYVNSSDGYLYALGGAKGDFQWKFQVQSGFNTSITIVSSPTVGPDGTIFVGSSDKHLYAVNPMTGMAVWSFTTGSLVQSSMAVSPDGTVYLGPGDGNVFALDGLTGNTKWKLNTGTSAVPSSPAIGADGTVYVGAGNNVIAFQSVHLTGLTLNPTSVLAGGSSTGTLTFDVAAPKGGVLVQLSADSTAVSLPKSVLLPEGQSACTFTTTTSGMDNLASHVITATYNGSAQTATLTVKHVSITSLSVMPGTITGGTAPVGTVVFDNPVPEGGLVVSLSVEITKGDANSVSVPMSLMVAPGSTSATFMVSSVGVDNPTTATITGTANSSSASGTLMVTPALLSTAMLTPTTVVGGTAVTGSVTLNGPAGPSGLAILLWPGTGTITSLTLPKTATVRAGETSASVLIGTSPVAAQFTATINWGDGTTRQPTQPTTLTILPTSLLGLSISPNSVVVGGTFTGTFTLTGPAPTNGITVNLKSDKSGVLVPSSVLVPAGKTSVSWTGSTKAAVLTSPLACTISGSITKDSWKTATVTVLPLDVASLTVSNHLLVGGCAIQLSGAVVLNGPAPKGGTVVHLTCSDVKSASVPATVTVKEGAVAANFTIIHHLVPSVKACKIGAKLDIIVISDSVTLTPFQVVSLGINPASVPGGKGAIGTVTLNAIPGTGSKAVSVNLRASSSVAVIKGGVVLVPIGAASAAFTVNTVPTPTDQAVTFTATVSTTTHGDTPTASLKVTAPSLLSIRLNPTAVTGGSISTCTITLTGPAPKGGIIAVLIALLLPAVPAHVVIPSGSTSVTFPVGTIPVKAQIVGSITTHLAGSDNSLSASLTVNPPALKDFTLSSTRIKGPGSCTGTVTLDGQAPIGGKQVAVFLEGDANIFTCPTSVTVPAGKTTGTFTVKVKKVTTTTTATIRCESSPPPHSKPIILQDVD